jgi:hypothetical protein
MARAGGGGGGGGGGLAGAVPTPHGAFTLRVSRARGIEADGIIASAAFEGR